MLWFRLYYNTSLSYLSFRMCINRLDLIKGARVLQFSLVMRPMSARSKCGVFISFWS